MHLLIAKDLEIQMERSISYEKVVLENGRAIIIFNCAIIHRTTKSIIFRENEDFSKINVYLA